MNSLKNLLDKNASWAERVDREDPTFFEKLSNQQSPEYLWIGCSDSRVSANAIVDLMPGEVFVHRNVANLVIHTDLNCLSVMQYAVDVLKVKHIIVCGHYNCGGIKATLDGSRHGLIDNWLCYVQDVYRKHNQYLDAIDDLGLRYDRLCELNVIEQVSNICQTTVIKDAWLKKQDISIHGWIYRVRDGRLRDLGTTIGCNDVADVLINDATSRICK